VGNNANIFTFTQAAGADGTGLAWFAATGSTAPTDATTALAAAWKNAGMITDNGVVQKFSESSKTIKAAGSTAIQRTLVTDDSFTFDIEFLENGPVAKAVFARKPIGSISPGVGTGAFSVTYGLYTRQLYAGAFDMLDGSNHVRLYCPTVETTTRKDITYNNANPATFGVTVTAYPDSTGVAVYEYNVMAALG